MLQINWEDKRRLGNDVSRMTETHQGRRGREAGMCKTMLDKACSKLGFIVFNLIYKRRGGMYPFFSSIQRGSSSWLA